MSLEFPFKEIDYVRIPETTAAAHRVKGEGTIVWHIPEADYATVECVRLDDNESGWKTELIDVGLTELEMVKPA